MKILAKGNIGLWQEKGQKILFGIKLAENIMDCQDNGRKLLDSNHWGLIAAAGSTPNFDMPHSTQSFAPIYVIEISIK